MRSHLIFLLVPLLSAEMASVFCQDNPSTLQEHFFIFSYHESPNQYSQVSRISTSSLLAHTWSKVHCVLEDILNRLYSIGRELRTKCIINGADISASRYLSLAARSLISIMCSYTIQLLLDVILESIFIRYWPMLFQSLLIVHQLPSCKH